MDDYGVELHFASATNSTFFSNCCGTAVINEKNCPGCGKKIIGHEIEDLGKRHAYRWRKTFKK